MMNYTSDIDNGLLITNESDEDSTIYFAIAAFSLILFLGICSWTQRLVLASQKKTPSALMTFFQASSRQAKSQACTRTAAYRIRLYSRVVDRCIPGLPSMGHLLVVLLYIGVNLILLFVNGKGTSKVLVSNYGRRFGW
jgi:hypothetical protein